MTSIREIARVNQRFQMMVLTPDPTTRDIIASAILGIMADLPFIILPNGNSTQQPQFKGNPDYPVQESIGVYRRDVNFDIVFPSYVVQVDPAILFVGGTINSVPFGQVSQDLS